MTQEWLSMRETADALWLDPLRLSRLGRHLHLAPGDACIPRTVIALAMSEPSEEERYRAVLDWLLTDLSDKRASGAVTVSGTVPTETE
jgi:hypothetical protein